MQGDIKRDFLSAKLDFGNSLYHTIGNVIQGGIKLLGLLYAGYCFWLPLGWGDYRQKGRVHKVLGHFSEAGLCDSAKRGDCPAGCWRGGQDNSMAPAALTLWRPVNCEGFF